MSGRQRFGVVAAFDDFKGYGTVRADDGTTLFFHCTAVADGTRTIPVGTRVTFAARPGHRGQWEASVLVALGAPGRP
jgi:cold shock CspA family protein